MSAYGALVIRNEAGTETAKITNGGLDVNIQDQTTPLVNLPFNQVIGSTTTTAISALDTYDVTVTSVASISVGNFLAVYNAASERYWFGTVMGIVGLVVTLDTPSNFAYQSGDLVVSASIDLNVDGSTTRQVFEIAGPAGGTVLDITRIIITMTLSSAGDDGKFGNIAGGITNGIVLRKTDGDYRNVWNVKDNGELAAVTYDLAYTTRSGGGGDYGMRSRQTFAGQEKFGVTIRLDAGDALQLIVQDDLTSLSRFRVIAQGHVVE